MNALWFGRSFPHPLRREAKCLGFVVVCRNPFAPCFEGWGLKECDHAHINVSGRWSLDADKIRIWEDHEHAQQYVGERAARWVVLCCCHRAKLAEITRFGNTSRWMITCGLCKRLLPAVYANAHGVASAQTGAFRGC